MWLVGYGGWCETMYCCVLAMSRSEGHVRQHVGKGLAQPPCGSPETSSTRESHRYRSWSLAAWMKRCYRKSAKLYGDGVGFLASCCGSRPQVAKDSQARNSQSDNWPPVLTWPPTC